VQAADWLKALRRAGHSVLLVHHSGKDGGQRGTSKREDLLDTVIALKRPEEYSPEQGAVFEVAFEKARGAFGEDVEPFQLTYTIDQECAVWHRSPILDAEYEAVLHELKNGGTVRSIADDLGISKSTVQRYRARAIKNGDYSTKT